MQRREFMALVGGATVTWPLGAFAQKAPVRIGFMASGAAGSAFSTAQIDNIKQGLRENGLMDGRDYVLDTQFAAGDYELFPEMTRKLMLAGARILLVNTIASARAAQNVNPPVPVVMLNINDPVGTGLVESFARPGGFTTGMASLSEDLTPKLFEFQLEVVPKASVIAALFNPANPTNPPYVAKLSAAAAAKGMTVVPFALSRTASLMPSSRRLWRSIRTRCNSSPIQATWIWLIALRCSPSRIAFLLFPLIRRSLFWEDF